MANAKDSSGIKVKIGLSVEDLILAIKEMGDGDEAGRLGNPSYCYNLRPVSPKSKKTIFLGAG